MNFNLTNQIFRQVKRTWESMRSAPAPTAPRRIDHLVRMNLPPLMGRRDAAYDRVGKLLNLDIFSGDENRRVEIYRLIAELMRRAGGDTRQLLAMITSRDTAERERNTLGYFNMVENSVRVLENFIELEERLSHNGSGPLHEFIAPGGTELAGNEQMLTETEITLVNQLRAIFERSEARLLRYRGYAVKNFSRDNAARYNSAYNAYSEVLASGINAIDNQL